MRLQKYIQETINGKLPKGWDKDSVKKLSKKIGKNPGDKGFFDACTKKMGKHIDSVEGFCANVKDVGLSSTYWRGKGKSKEQVKKDTEKNKNVG